MLDATDRIPYGELDHQYVFNFWQDAAAPQGHLAAHDRCRLRERAPTWDVLLDIDKLAAEEHENWVWKGADCTPSLKRCLISLSRGGGDAVVVREFDPRPKVFVKDGFALAEAKSADHLARRGYGRVRAPTSVRARMTTSGYPRIVKVWKRGKPLGERAHGVRRQGERRRFRAASCSTIPPARSPLIQRSRELLQGGYFLLAADGTTAAARSAARRGLEGRAGRTLLFTLRDDWTSPRSRVDRQGLAGRLPRRGPREVVRIGIEVLYAPDARSSIEQVSVGPRCRLCVDQSRRRRRGSTCSVPGAKAVWSEHDARAASRRLDPHRTRPTISAPKHNSASRVSRRRRRSTRRGRRQTGRDQIAAAALRCIEPHERAIRSDLERRHEDSVLRHAPESAQRPDADRALRLWRLRDLDDAGLFGEFRTAVAVERRHLCAGQHPRRRRVRPGVAPGGAEGEPPEGL